MTHVPREFVRDVILKDRKTRRKPKEIKQSEIGYNYTLRNYLDGFTKEQKTELYPRIAEILRVSVLNLDTHLRKEVYSFSVEAVTKIAKLTGVGILPDFDQINFAVSEED